MLEHLDPRRLLSSAVIGDLHPRELHVVGDANSPNTIVVTYATTNIEVVINGGALQNFANDNIDDIRVEGGNLNDTITFAGTWFRLQRTRVIRAFGLDGDDTITGAAVHARPGHTSVPSFELNGGYGNDTLTGMGHCTINGDNGNDHIFASDPSDPSAVPMELIYGGNNSDLIEGGTGLSNYIFGGRGDDIIRGGIYQDIVFGGDGGDSITGGNGSDTIFGNGGDDTIFGGKGDDAIYGDLGNDLLEGSGGFDTVYGGRGNDSLPADPNDFISGAEFDRVSKIVRAVLDGVAPI